MSIKKKCDSVLPGDLDTIEASEIFALIILLATLGLASFGEIELSQPVVRSIIATSMFVLFGSKYNQMRTKRKKRIK